MVDAITKLEPFDFGEENIPEYTAKVVIPDGIYNVEVNHLSIGSKADPRTFIVTMNILDGDWKGQKITNFFNIYKSKMSANKFKLFLTMLGLTSTEILQIGKDINNLLDVVVGLKLRVKTKQEGEYTRVAMVSKSIPTYSNGENILQRYKDKQELLKTSSNKQGLWK